jgi:hypothetical protein
VFTVSDANNTIIIDSVGDFDDILSYWYYVDYIEPRNHRLMYNVRFTKPPQGCSNKELLMYIEYIHELQHNYLLYLKMNNKV